MGIYQKIKPLINKRIELINKKTEIMKNKIITSLGAMLLTIGAFAQQNATFSQYFFNPMYVNPAYAGSRGTFSGTMVYRTQWVGMEGAPVTESVGMHTMIPGSNFAVGLQFNNDELGPMRTTGISAILAYHLHLGEKTRLAFGLEGCMDNINIAYSDIDIENPEDPSFMNNNASAWVPEANAGLYLYRDKFFAGVSVKNLLESNLGPQYAGTSEAEFYKNYYFTTGFVSRLSENVGIRPSILVNYIPAAPALIDLDASLIFHDRFFIGAGFRTDKRIGIDGMDNALIVSIEYDVANRLRFGYSYDFYLTQGASYTNGTHEIMLGWDLYSNKTRMTSPKYF
jgi:type IX secretion system PorP/SprF family membrane protein